jgi:hypothetical protein
MKMWLDKLNFAPCMAHKYKVQASIYIITYVCVCVCVCMNMNIQQYVLGPFILQTKLTLLNFAGVHLMLLNIHPISLHIFRNCAKFVIIKYLLTGLWSLKMLTLP